MAPDICAKCGQDRDATIHRSSLYPRWHLFRTREVPPICPDCGLAESVHLTADECEAHGIDAGQRDGLGCATITRQYPARNPDDGPTHRFRPSRTPYQQTEVCEVCGDEEGQHFPNR